MFKSAFTCVAVVFLLFFSTPASAVTGEPAIRVLIGKNLPHVKKVSSDNLTWINGTPYKGEIIVKQTAPGKMSVINVLSLEDYIEGLLPGEMPKDWPLEALKSQAVAARSYAYYTLREKTKIDSKSSYDIKATIEDQVYNGGAYSGKNVLEAVSSTRGQIITYHGKPIKTRFHSTCGGKTETGIHVWGKNDISKSISDPYCKASPHGQWKVSISQNEISNKLGKRGFDLGLIKSISPETFGTDGRVAAISIHGSRQTLSLTGNDFRRYLGFARIKSTLFSVKKSGSLFLFTGRGFGHGVGMCQWGAKSMAENGFSYNDILNFYYPGTKALKIY